MFWRLNVRFYLPVFPGDVPLRYRPGICPRSWEEGLLLYSSQPVSAMSGGFPLSGIRMVGGAYFIPYFYCPRHCRHSAADVMSASVRYPTAVSLLPVAPEISGVLFLLMLVGLLEAAPVVYYYGPERLRPFIDDTSEIPIGRWWDLCVKVVLALLAVLVAHRIQKSESYAEGGR
jgi:hypothetical protein